MHRNVVLLLISGTACLVTCLISVCHALCRHAGAVSCSEYACSGPDTARRSSGNSDARLGQSSTDDSGVPGHPFMPKHAVQCVFWVMLTLSSAYAFTWHATEEHLPAIQ